MKMSIVFSSLTGNTKKVAEEILKMMPKGTDIYDLKELEITIGDFYFDVCTVYILSCCI